MALITVILVTSLVAMLAVSMSFAQHVAMRRTANLLDGDRAMVLALGLEEWGRQVLIRDNKNGGVSDNLGENWAMGLPPTAVDNGMVSGSFIDLQGRINLNNLVSQDADEIAKAELMLTQLFDYCEADNGADLVQAVADWLDADLNTRPGGAEDNEYLLHDPPYLAANRPMISPSELLLVEGVTPELYLCVKDHVTALPSPTKININTADPVVISTLSPQLLIEDGEEIVRDRPEDGYKDINDFLTHPRVVAIGSAMKTDGLTTTSDYFMAQERAVFGKAEIELNSLFSRKRLVEVVRRSIGTY